MKLKKDALRLPAALVVVALLGGVTLASQACGSSNECQAKGGTAGKGGGGGGGGTGGTGGSTEETCTSEGSDTA